MSLRLFLAEKWILICIVMMVSTLIIGALNYYILILSQAYLNRNHYYSFNGLLESPSTWAFFATLTFTFWGLVVFICGLIFKVKLLAFAGSLIPLIIGVVGITGAFGPTLSQIVLYKITGKASVRKIEFNRKNFSDPILQKLIVAVDERDQTTIQNLVSSGFNINTLSISGETALVLFSEAMDVEGVKLLLKNGANPQIAEVPADDYYGSWRSFPLAAVWESSGSWRTDYSDLIKVYELRSQFRREIGQALIDAGASFLVKERLHDLAAIVLEEMIAIEGAPNNSTSIERYKTREWLVNLPDFQKAIDQLSTSSKLLVLKRAFHSSTLAEETHHLFRLKTPFLTEADLKSETKEDAERIRSQLREMTLKNPEILKRRYSLWVDDALINSP